MGAEPYQYLVDYEEDVQNALNRLRQQVFESGQFNGADLNPSTPEEALELAEEEGTRSILDIMSIADQPEYFAAAPFSTQELQGYFGTDRPTAATVAGSDLFWDDLERGMARYTIIYEADAPRQILFVGYSFD
jgi:hypothetical protein